VLPIIWLLGPSGVGKSTVGFRLLSTLAAAGIPAGYVDADQLRLARGLDASEDELVASGIPLVEREYRARGARVLLISGIADDRGHLARLLPGARPDRLLAVHLAVDADTLRERIRRRGSLVELTEESVEYAAVLDSRRFDLRIETAGRAPSDIAGVVAEATRAFLDREPGETGDEGDPVAVEDETPARLVLMSGPGGVGLSTVGYQTYSRIAGTGEPTGYLDAYQLGFLGAHPRSAELAPIRARTVSVIAANFARHGARTVVVSGDPCTVRLLAGTSAGAASIVWLDASPAALAERITARARGEGPGIPGDHRRGLSGEDLAGAIDAAVSESSGRDLLPPRTVAIDTTGMDPCAVADAVVRASTT
jgi:hypothetical protein